MAYTFFFEADRCLKCWSCELACLQWHGIKAGTVKLRRVTEVTTGTFPDVKRTFASTACRHCAKPPCAAACPTGAISRRPEDGIVVVDSQKCDGCRTCLDACPFDVPEFDEDGTMRICDMCLDRLERGQKPVCVEACPTQALHWGTVAEMSGLAGRKAAGKSVGA
jgi:anaerobic dimethyl sulfoxide reductase subunit B (iron-sulfur subunit)